jgi:hypothetical protein
MDFKAILHSKWTWIVAGVLGAGYVYSRVQANNAANAAANSANNLASAYPGVYSVPYSGGYGSYNGTTSINGSNPLATDPTQYLQSIIDATTANNKAQTDLAAQQAADQLQLGLASINSNNSIAALNAQTTNTAIAAQSYQTTVNKLGPNLDAIDGTVTASNGSVASDVIGIAGGGAGGSKAGQRNSQLLSALSGGGYGIILPTGGVITPTLNPALAHNAKLQITGQA